MIESSLIKELNAKQKQAVTAPRQPILVIAGPGTGKTRTIIARIIYEISHYQIAPEQILALTFSNKAANEIKTRLSLALKEKAEKVKTGTFHSFCLDVLRKYHEKAGLHKYFTVCNSDYQFRLLQQIISQHTREKAERKVSGISLAFSNHLLKQKPLPAFSALIFDEYQNHLNKHNLIDFDQILTKTLSLFRDYNDILNQYRFLNQSILIDEFQDTDPVQYEIIKLLAEEHRNIFTVADDDQSIYAWRGAHPENIKRFMQDFFIKEPVFLDINYRNGKHIMDTAQSIVRTTDRIEPDKTISALQDVEATIQALFFDDESREIDYIIKKIDDLQKNHFISLSEIAVIYPRHVFGDKLANSMLKKRIPFQLANGKNLQDHPSMKKIILYLNMIRDPADALILEELVEKELCYTIYKQIQDYSRLNQISFRKALNDFSQRPEINYKLRNQISTFIGNIANLVNLKTFFTFDRLINEIIKSSQDLSNSVLKHNTLKLEDLKIEPFPGLQNPEVNIWIYHSDQKLTFIAEKMLERALGKRVRLLSHENIVHVKPGDLALLLEPLPTENLSCKYELLFSLTNERRKGVISILFRWLQIQLKGGRSSIFNDYVIFDLETTGKDPDNCAIVEIAAVHVKDGRIVDEYQTLVNPETAIEPEAKKVHNISEEDVRDAPKIADIWSDFREFVGGGLLMAHNGYGFDFKIIDRITRKLGRPKLENTRYDSLIFARMLFPNQQNSIDGLTDRFKLDAGTRHRALDDVRVLHSIFQKMLSIVERIDIKSGGEEFTEFAALGSMLENTLSATEDKIIFLSGISKLTTPYSKIRSAYIKQFAVNGEELNANLDRISRRLSPQIDEYSTIDDFQKRILDMAMEFKPLPIDQAIAQFLSYLSLVNTQDSLNSIDAVSLITYHAAKGLEFDRVIIMGLEENHMPSFFAYKSDDEDDRSVSKKLEEQKRLLYVGITRAKSEVVFTIVKNRFGRQQKSSPFLQEIKEHINLNLPS